MISPFMNDDNVQYERINDKICVESHLETLNDESEENKECEDKYTVD